MTSLVLFAIALLLTAPLAHATTTQALNATPSPATKSAAYRDLDISLTMRDDGTFHLEETQVVDFTGGPFTRGYRALPLKRTEGINNAAVYELVAGKRVAYERSASGMADTYAIQMTGEELTLTWQFSPTTDTSRTFIVVYDMLGALRHYPELNPPNQQVWYMPVGSDLTDEISVISATFTLNLPRPAEPESVLLAVDGKVRRDLPSYTSDYQTFSFAHDNFVRGQSWEIRLQTNIVARSAAVPAWQEADDRQRQEAEETPTATASDCDGLVQYQRDMEDAVGPVMMKYRDAVNDMPDDPMQFSSDDWTVLADIILDYHRALKTVTPPDWAEAWHDELIAYTATMEQMIRAISAVGVFGALPYSDTIEATEARLREYERDIRVQCAQFAEFADQWGMESSINASAGRLIATRAPST
jgi:hypothetical protein